MSAYNPPPVGTGTEPAPPRYENAAKIALTVMAWVGLVGGPLLMIIAATFNDRYNYRNYDSLVAAADVFRVGGVILVLGVLALFALLVARSVTYDLMYRFGPRPDYRPAATVDATEHFTPDPTT